MGLVEFLECKRLGIFMIIDQKTPLAQMLGLPTPRKLKTTIFFISQGPFFAKFYVVPISNQKYSVFRERIAINSLEVSQNIQKLDCIMLKS